MSNLCIQQPTLVCRGIAKKLSLKVSGRRNAIGKIIGRRQCEWQSGTCPALAILLRSNTHTAPNYRLPLTKHTHDDDACPSQACAEWTRNKDSTKVLSKLAQRAQREATGYYCGYTFKRQPVGMKYLHAMAQSYDSMEPGLANKTRGQIWHRVLHRLLADFQHRSMVRTAPEEWNLAANWHDHDPTAAEFVRTYRSIDFPGGALLQRLEMEETQRRRVEISKVIPTAHGRRSGPEDHTRHFVDFYGYRGMHPAVYYLNPWEFVMHWEVVPLPRPTEPTSDNPVPMSRPKKKDPSDYELNPEARQAVPSIQDRVIFFEEVKGNAQLRDRWYMRRRLRPMIPAPSSTPMPDKARCRERKAKLFSVYLRPWVLDPEKACPHDHVPHLADLNLVRRAQRPPTRLRQKATSSEPELRCYAEAWSNYVGMQCIS